MKIKQLNDFFRGIIKKIIANDLFPGNIFLIIQSIILIGIIGLAIKFMWFWVFIPYFIELIASLLVRSIIKLEDFFPEYVIFTFEAIVVALLIVKNQIIPQV
jgi:hypothetical protein